MSLDLLLDGTLNWFTRDQYEAFGATIAGLTGAAMRLGIKKTE